MCKIISEGDVGAIVTDLAEAFNANAPPPPQLQPEQYRRLLEYLVRDGEGYGKVKHVAAYPLRNIRLVTEEEGHADKQQEIPLPDLYVVMDPVFWPNEYIRTLGMEDIARQWSKRIVEEKDINAPDFKGPGVWTAEKAAFEEDYIRREGVDEYGKPLTIYDPNPDTYRVCLYLPGAVTIPATWGNYSMGPGGALAVREKELPALAEALQSIREGKATTAEALYTQNSKGETVARFDVYGMDPGFLEDNYDPVKLKQETQAASIRLRSRRKLPPASFTEREETMLPYALEKIIAQNTFAGLPKDGAVFWAEGEDIIIPQDRKTFATNDELAQSLLATRNAIAGKTAFTDLQDALDPGHGARKRSSFLPPMKKDVSHFEAQEFWRRMNIRFAEAAEGTVHVAASGGAASSTFRLYGFDALMENDAVTDVEVVTGKPRTDVIPYVDRLTHEFNACSLEDWQKKWRSPAEDVILLCYQVIADDGLKTMPKQAWAEWQKQDWFDTACAKLFNHIDREPAVEDRYKVGVFFNDRADSDVIYAKTRFLQEVVFILHETDRLKKAVADGDAAAGVSLKAERGRLRRACDILEKYPEITYFNEPATALEMERSPSTFRQLPRAPILTQELGGMMMQLDPSMTLEERNRLWGRNERYDFTFPSFLDKQDQPADYLGHPKETEKYVRTQLAGLKDRMQQELANEKAPAASAKIIPFPPSR